MAPKKEIVLIDLSVATCDLHTVHIVKVVCLQPAFKVLLRKGIITPQNIFYIVPSSYEMQYLILFVYNQPLKCLSEKAS